MDDQRDYAEESANRYLHEDWPEPTAPRPDVDDLRDMLSGEGDTDATDGCYVEPDGVCEHGHPSWPLYLHII